MRELRVVIADDHPSISGEKRVTALRRMPTHDARLVVVSGGRDARRIAEDLGAAPLVPKPFSIRELSEAVHRVAHI